MLKRLRKIIFCTIFICPKMRPQFTIVHQNHIFHQSEQLLKEANTRQQCLFDFMWAFLPNPPTSVTGPIAYLCNTLEALIFCFEYTASLQPLCL